MEKKDDTCVHFAVRTGESDVAFEMLNIYEEQKLVELLLKKKQSGETSLYVAAEYGCVDLVKEMIKYYGYEAASIKAKNGFDAFHIAAKQGNLEVLKVLMEMHPELSITFDQNNTTPLHSASEEGHIEVVNYLLEINSSMANIARSNLKTALHSCARKGHLEVVKALSQKVPGIIGRLDNKGQTALHMAVKGQNVEVVNALIEADNGLINTVDNNDNTTLHITTRKGCTEIAWALLNHKGILNKEVTNKYGETALDIAERLGQSEIAIILQQHGVPKSKSIKNSTTLSLTLKTCELKQTVINIKNGVHNQGEHALKTQKKVKGTGIQIKRMHLNDLTDAIRFNTVFAILIATVTFAAIFQLPGQYIDNPNNIPNKFSLGEANIASNPEFFVFLIFDSLALFISLGVVVGEASIVVVEKRVKIKLMAVINRLMWLAYVFVSIAFLALCFIVVGNEKWLAVGVTIIGSLTLVSTLAPMCHWAIMHRIEVNTTSGSRRSKSSSRSV